MVLDFILERGNYYAIIGLMMIGLYITFASANLVKRLVGLGLFQTSIVLFYVSLGKVHAGSAPILYGKDYGYGPDSGTDYGVGNAGGAGESSMATIATGGYEATHMPDASVLANVYSNPLPHVLMLTAIVVGVATLSVGLAIIVRIREAYGVIETDAITASDLAETAHEHAGPDRQGKA